jgi:hypothetical protein
MIDAAMVEEAEEPSGILCERCQRSCEAFEIAQCPICRKPFCIYCAYHIGGRAYCGRDCGNVFFFGSEDEDGEIDDSG